MTTRLELAAAALLAIAASGLVGCASAPAEIDLPPQTLTSGPGDAARLGADPSAPVSGAGESSGETGELPPAEEPPPVEGGPASRSQTVVIQAGEKTDVTPQTLFEASQAERARRAASDGPSVTLTNENLAEQAEGGELTVASAPPGEKAGGDEAAASAPDSEAAGEEYWRMRGLDIRQRWKDAAEHIGELEARAETLRRRFYDEDDPVYRDSEIKPAWDQTLEDLKQARVEVRDRQDELDAFLEEGRRAGAFPGWLDEGAYLEPKRQVEEDDQAERRRGADPREPKILDESEIRQ